MIQASCEHAQIPTQDTNVHVAPGIWESPTIVPFLTFWSFFNNVLFFYFNIKISFFPASASPVHSVVLPPILHHTMNPVGEAPC